MKILITGGAGFIGSSICLYLKNKYPNYRIIAFDNLRRRGSELNLLDLKQSGVEFLHGDIRNKEDLDAVGGYDVMIDASAEPSVIAGLNATPAYVINNNLSGSVNCFESCLKNKAKIIFLSTSRVYPIDKIENASFFEDETRFSFSSKQMEKGISEKGISENLSLTGFRSFYGATKLSSELLLQEYAAFYGLETVITRFGVVAGPRQMGKTDQGIATLWMAKHYWKKPLKYIGYGGNGKQVRDILHIDDLVDLIDLQLHHTGKFKSVIYNAGGGFDNSLSLQEMTKLCERITGNKIDIIKEPINRQADLRVYISDNSKIISEVGWKPKKCINDIYNDILKWINQNEMQLYNYIS